MADRRRSRRAFLWRDRPCFLARRETAVDYSNHKLDERTQDFVWERCDLGPDGNLFVAPDRNAYRIEVYRPDGSLNLVITREFESLQRDEALRNAARQRLASYARYIPNAQADIGIESTEPDVSDLRVLADGRVWVRTSRGDRDAPSGCLTTYDVYAPDGLCIEQMALKCPGDLLRDQLFLLSAERLIRVVGGSDAALAQLGAAKPQGEATDEGHPLEVICYDIAGQP